MQTTRSDAEDHVGGSSGMNGIQRAQNAESNVILRRAAAWTYDRAMWLRALQFVASVCLPAVGAAVASFSTDWKPHVAALSAAVVALDVALLERMQKKLLNRAARISEEFDCAVLQMPWDESLGEKVDPEDVYRAARLFAARHPARDLLDWYPTAVADAPLHVARLLCQRANLRYDSALRKTYATLVLVVCVCMSLLLLARSLLVGDQMTSFVLTMAPAVPVLKWGVAEYLRQTDASNDLVSIMSKLMKTWRQVVDGALQPGECLDKSRRLQDAIFARRSTLLPVLPALYSIKRLNLEDEMQAAATNLLREYERAQTSKLEAASKGARTTPADSAHSPDEPG